MADRKRYCVGYVCPTTGYNWESHHDHLKDAERLARETVDDVPNAMVTLYDYKRGEFLYLKRAWDYKPEIDLLHDIARDFRTKCGKAKWSDAYVAGE